MEVSRFPHVTNFASASQGLTPVEVAQLAKYCDAHVFDTEVFRALGVFVVRGIFPLQTVTKWQAAWAAFQGDTLAARKVGFNKVAVEEPLPPVLASMYESPEHRSIACHLFGEDVGLYNHRFVIKDQYARDPVFLHQDYCYHLGFPNKASFFVPLSLCGRENGGLEFFLGTHQYGYLGDAGEIDQNAFPSWPSILPELRPGDLVVMNSLTWHRSGPHVSGPDRILADTILQPAYDPSSVAVIFGDDRWAIRIDPAKKEELFKRSRTSKIKELSTEVEALKAVARR
jgi:hypothetical protein